MTIIKGEADLVNGYFIVSQNLWSYHLSNASKIIYYYLISKPADWFFTPMLIMTQCDLSRRDTYKAFRELLSKGFLRKKYARKRHGEFSHIEYDFASCPSLFANNGSRLKYEKRNGLLQEGARVSKKKKASDILSTGQIKPDVSPRDHFWQHGPHDQFGHAILNKDLSSLISKECVLSDKRENVDNNTRDSFEQIWSMYPNKVCKEQAWAIWEQLSADIHEQCTYAIRLQVQEYALKNKHSVWNPTWKYLSSWLKNKCWKNKVMTEEEIIQFANRHKTRFKGDTKGFIKINEQSPYPKSFFTHTSCNEKMDKFNNRLPMPDYVRDTIKMLKGHRLTPKEAKLESKAEFCYST